MNFSTSATLCLLLLITTESLASPYVTFSPPDNSLSQSQSQSRSQSQYLKPSSNPASKSKGYVKTTLDKKPVSKPYMGLMYMLNLTIGSNNQPISLLLDTGSSDMWVVNANNSWCSETSQGEGEYDYDNVYDYHDYSDDSDSGSDSSDDDDKPHDCSLYGTFSPTDSDTWEVIPGSGLFSILYGGGSYANGTLGQDTVTIQGVEVNDVQFAQCDEANDVFGVLGIESRVNS
ncbi:unnamed protein product [Ambrosiozyma monospora]|uniref:Unnamed protein product n=1 Tax=Ambrosiozyma monospora TaxID=43982 RepID=A0ACB5U8R3_AMBMO|nr:unnamed protein product [Ambrosiozyma monospora]